MLSLLHSRLPTKTSHYNYGIKPPHRWSTRSTWCALCASIRPNLPTKSFTVHTIRIVILLHPSVAKLWFTKMGIQEDRGHQEALADGIYVLQWTITGVTCIMYLKLGGTAYRDQQSYSHNTSSFRICPRTNTCKHSPTNSQKGRQRQTTPPRVDDFYAWFKIASLRCYLLHLLERNNGWRSYCNGRQNKEWSTQHPYSPFHES